MLRAEAPLTAVKINALLNPEPVRALLRWMNDPEEYRGGLDAAAWGAELAAGEGRGRIYLVEPTGPVEDDPNLTGKKFRGNPTKSFRSREPLRITGEIVDWQGHTPEAIKAMKDGLDRLKQLGLMAIDD